MIVTCPKCGQALMNEDDRTLTDTEAAELALQTCTPVGHGKVKIGKSGKGSISVKRTVGHTEELKANEKY